MTSSQSLVSNASGSPVRSGREDSRGGSLKQEKSKILVVDDAGPVVILCVNILQSLGYAVKGANRGEAALEHLRNDAYDLMIVDYRMPGMDGFQVFEQARTIRPEMACMLITAHGTTEVTGRAMEVGFGAVLLKPFTKDELRTAVETALSGKR
jgi:CheY-like chemotaxis protein